MDTASISISSNDKSKKKRLPMISILVTLRMNAVEERGLGALESTLGYEPSLRHRKEPSFTPIGNLSPQQLKL